jgi:inner membrane protein
MEGFSFMDTLTHITMGVALGGLATLDPIVAEDPVVFHSVLAGTIIGSHAPDFDTILKLKNNAVYIRNHRGITHSIPAIFVWAILITAFIYIFAPISNVLHLFIWTLVAVSLHIFVDIFNAYGTQAARPINHKWIAFGFINTFDPYIFSFLIIGIAFWIFGADPGITFAFVFTVIFIYYLKRYFDKKRIIDTIKEHFDNVEQIVTSPTIRQKIWRIAITTKDKFYVARAENGSIKILDQFIRKELPDHPAMKKSLEDENIQAFLSFSPVYRWEIKEMGDQTEIRFTDLRYRSKEHYPFIAVVKLDRHLQIINSYTGWIYSKEKLRKKLKPIPNG